MLLEDELSHKGIDKAVQINKVIINSNEYRRKFDNATDNPKVNKTLYECAKEILYDRSGSTYESMWWIDGETGEVIAKFNSMGKIPALTGKEHELKVTYGGNILRKLKGYNNIIVIHNHPNSSAPSVGDFNSAYLRGYSMGFVATHDGRLFRYSSHQKISDYMYDFVWKKYISRGYAELEAQIMAIEQFARDSEITFEEVLRT
ncbi:MAG: hypothetical protein LBL98_04580 [Ruminococcus sp.]|nr:hypothetical protein [Ruminococcus sp.]